MHIIHRIAQTKKNLSPSREQQMRRFKRKSGTKDKERFQIVSMYLLFSANVMMRKDLVDKNKCEHGDDHESGEYKSEFDKLLSKYLEVLHKAGQIRLDQFDDG